jgi:von Willebrand factor A domain-containing protein 8
VPPYPGYPLDPPFRSRFQARFVDPVRALQALGVEEYPKNFIFAKLRDIILATQYASESRNALEVVSRSSLPPFPQTSIVKLVALFNIFPPSPYISPGHLGRLFLTLHPALIHAPFQAWAMLSRQVSDAGLGELGSPAEFDETDSTGLLGYVLEKIERTGEFEARVTFSGYQTVSVVVPAGPKSLQPYPFQDIEHLDFRATERFLGLLTGIIQAHALGWDISLIPPALPSTASCSTSTLVRVFSQLLGYEADVVHMYKELGGRELLMRREILTDGATQWEPRYEDFDASRLLGYVYLSHVF